ncbi:histidine kinase, partial [Paenibacillus riograndensis]
MIRKYIKEKLSWLLLLGGLQIIFLFVAYVDSSIPFFSVLYIVVLNIMVCTAFVFLRYHKETRFYQRMCAWDEVY